MVSIRSGLKWWSIVLLPHYTQSGLQIVRQSLNEGLSIENIRPAAAEGDNIIRIYT